MLRKWHTITMVVAEISVVEEAVLAEAEEEISPVPEKPTPETGTAPNAAKR